MFAVGLPGVFHHLLPSREILLPNGLQECQNSEPASDKLFNGKGAKIRMCSKPKTKAVWAGNMHEMPCSNVGRPESQNLWPLGKC